MNKQIKELITRVWCIPLDDFLEVSWDFEEKFAELIVHQMLEITDAHTEVFQTDRDKALIEHIKQSVRQHFGVEE